MSSTLYALVTCCLEVGRYEILKQVVDNITQQSNFDDINANLIVIDNASTIEGVLETLSPFKTVYRVDRNIGYWTALKWIGSQRSSHHKYIYSIESDCLHHDMERIGECESFLDNNVDVSMIRTQEFKIAERHLYDKNKPVAGSLVYAWQSQTNRFRNNERVEFSHQNGNIWKSNFTPVVCGLNRLDDFNSIMEELATMKKISEADFQGKFDARYPYVGVYDGGLFHSRLSFMNMQTVAGSRPSTHIEGYRSTQHDRIDADGTFTITRVK